VDGFRRLAAVVVALLALGLEGTDAYVQVRLTMHHVTTTATVEQSTRGKWGNEDRITFVAQGTPVRAWLDVPWFVHLPVRGCTVAVEYDPADPARVRRAGSHDFAMSTLAYLGLFLLALVGGFMSSDRHRDTRRERTTASSDLGRRRTGEERRTGLRQDDDKCDDEGDGTRNPEPKAQDRDELAVQAEPEDQRQGPS